MKFFKKNAFILLGTTTLIIIPPLALSCSPENKSGEETRVVTQVQIEESAFFFYEMLFNSSYWQQLLLEQEYQTIEQADILNFALKHPLLKNLTKKTQDLITSNLKNIKLTNSNDLKKIELEVNNINFSYELHNFLNSALQIYTFDNQQKQVNVELDKLTSWTDLFNVFNDIWNLKAQYNFLTTSSYSRIYDYQLSDSNLKKSSLTILTKRAQINNLYANIYSWNFDYQINFKSKKENYQKFNISEYQKNYNFISDFAKSYDEFFSINDWNSKVSEQYQKVKSNYSIYPIYDLQEDNNENQILQTYSNLALTTYQYFDKIWGTFFQDFAAFSKSSIFSNWASQETFNNAIEIYQYDTDQKKVTKQKLNNVSYLEKPEELIDKALNSANLSYLQWMFSQYLFNTNYYDIVKEIKADKKQFENITTIKNNNKIMVNDLQNDSFIIKQNEIAKPNAFSDNSQKLKVVIPLQAKYGFSFETSEVFNQAFALKQKSVADEYDLTYVEQEILVEQDIIKPKLKIDSSSANFFSPNKSFESLVTYDFNEQMANLMSTKVLNLTQIGNPSFTKKPLTVKEIEKELEKKEKISFNWIGQEKFAISSTNPYYFFLKNIQDQDNYYSSLTLELVYRFDSNVNKSQDTINYSTNVNLEFQTY